MSQKNTLTYAWNLFSAKCKRAWILYATAMRRFGELWLAVLLSGVYLVFGAFARKSIQSHFSDKTNTQTLTLAEQVREFETKVRTK